MQYEDNTQTTGNTPLVQLRRVVPQGGARVLAKIEGRNPGYSVKCRIAVTMVREAEKSGALRPGMTILEPTSGNTGIGLAMVGAARGYRVTITMPESMSVERRKVLKAFGASVVLTEKERGMAGAIAKALAIAKEDPANYWIPMQFENPANPLAHMESTGPEIFRDTEGNVDVFVSGVGTGGTITGVGRYLREVKHLATKLVAVEPAESPVLTQSREGHPVRPAPHGIQGIGAGFVPPVLDTSLIDEVICVRTPEAMEMARLLAAKEGIICGVSSGAAVAAAAELAARPELKGKTIVVVLPDSGERYLSGALFEGVFPGIETAKAGDVL